MPAHHQQDVAVIARRRLLQPFGQRRRVGQGRDPDPGILVLEQGVDPGEGKARVGGGIPPHDRRSVARKPRQDLAGCALAGGHAGPGHLFLQRGQACDHIVRQHGGRARQRRMDPDRPRSGQGAGRRFRKPAATGHRDPGLQVGVHGQREGGLTLGQRRGPAPLAQIRHDPFLGLRYPAPRQQGEGEAAPGRPTLPRQIGLSPGQDFQILAGVEQHGLRVPWPQFGEDFVRGGRIGRQPGPHPRCGLPRQGPQQAHRCPGGTRQTFPFAGTEVCYARSHGSTGWTRKVNGRPID